MVSLDGGPIDVIATRPTHGEFRPGGLELAPALSPDGQRFLMVRPVGDPDPDQLIVIENWSQELDALLRDD